MSLDMKLETAREWVVSGLVVVKYPKDDIVGLFFGYYSLLVYQIQAVYITLFLWNRDLLTFYCCFTHLLSEIMNYLLKHTLKEARPDHGAPGGGLFEGRQHICSSKKTLALLISSIGLMLQVMGRIYLRFHTVNQCLAGIAFGCISAFTFYLLGVYIFLPYTEPYLKWTIFRMFSFRKDLVTPPPSSIHRQPALSRNKVGQCKSKHD